MTAKANFGAILNKQISTVQPPPLLPVAQYRLVVKKLELIESSQKKTPGAEFSYGVEGPAPGQNPDLNGPDGQPLDLSKVTLRDTFWLSDPALPMLRIHLEEHLGIAIGTMTFAEVLNNYTVGARCIGDVTQKPRTKGEGFYNEITGYAKA
jgi:hypothetical protein